MGRLRSLYPAKGPLSSRVPNSSAAIGWNGWSDGTSMLGMQSWPSGKIRVVLSPYWPCSRPTAQRNDSSRILYRLASTGEGFGGATGPGLGSAELSGGLGILFDVGLAIRFGREGLLSPGCEGGCAWAASQPARPAMIAVRKRKMPMRHHRDDPGPWGFQGGRPVLGRHGRSPRVPWPEFSGGPRLNKFVAKIKLSVAPSARGESRCRVEPKKMMDEADLVAIVSGRGADFLRLFRNRLGSGCVDRRFDLAKLLEQGALDGLGPEDRRDEVEVIIPMS